MKTVALIPAAGSSSRFRELGKHYAKTVLPFRGRPIIAHIVERIIEAKTDIDKIFVIVNNSTHREQIEEALGTCNFGSVGLCVVHEFNEEEIDIKRGPAKTIVAGLDLIRSRYQEDVEVLVHLSDSLFKASDIKSMFFEKCACVGTQLVDDQKRWCVVDKDNRFHNKPTENIQGAEALSGLYKFRLSSIDIQRAVFCDQESQISDLLLTINDHIELICAPIELDFGTLEEYIANRGIKTTRSFNVVFDHGDCVIKTTICGSRVEYDSKLRREINWYAHAPSVMKPYLPSIYYHSDLSDTRERALFKMEKIKGVNLRDLALYLDRTEETWTEIFTTYSITVTDEEGNEIPVTVIEYVVNDLKEDDLAFHNPLHRQILTEAATHIHDAGFIAERYFLAHPDQTISRLSVDLINVRYQLSKYHSKSQKIVTDEERLYELVPMLMINFKYAIVTEELKHMLYALQDPALAHDNEKCNSLMQRYNEMREVQSLMAKRLGDRVVLR
jgi:dTDP-glucose pyrophosphorylase